MILLCIIVFINIIQSLHCLYLNKFQISLINKLIQEPTLTNNQRHKINHILFTAYEKWSIKKAFEFKTLHRYKCMDIKNEELILYSKIGLFKSIQKYNGKFDFMNYSKIYIKSELLKLLTDKYSLSILPKKYRKHNKYNLAYKELHHYKQVLTVNLFSKYETYHLDLLFSREEDKDILSKLHKKYQYQEDIYNLVSNLSPFTRRIIYLKYCSDKKVSNKHISILMGCSEETIRKHLNKIKRNEIE